MVNLICFNKLYVLTDKNYRRYLKAVARGEIQDLDTFGKSSKASVELLDVSDINSEDAKKLLAEFDSNS